MTDHEEDVTQTTINHELGYDDGPELSPSEVVARFGDEIRAAIAAIADEAPRVAKEEAKQAARDEMKKEIMRTTVRWYLTSVFITLVIALAVCYLMLNYSPRSHAADITYERGFNKEICARDNLRSTEAHPMYLCTTP
jgi:hypothetical protein